MLPDPSIPVLCIHYNFPPVRAVGAIRNFSLSEELAGKTRVFVITSTNTRRAGASVAGLEGIPLYFAYCFDYKTLSFNLPDAVSRNPPSTLRVSLKKLLERFRLTFPFLLLLDRGGLLYIIHAYLIGRRLIRKEGIRVIYSSYQPYADHIIAFLLKRSFPGLCWIADLRDQPVDLYRKNVWWPKLQHRLNRKLLSAADALTTVSDGVKRQIESYHSDVYVIPNGIDTDLLKAAEPEFPNAFRIAYTGALYQGERDPSPLFAALTELIRNGRLDPDHLEIVYAGPDGAIWDQYFRKFAILAHCNLNLGWVSRQEARQIQRSAAINLLLTWATSQVQGILTGKVYEYLAATRPVVALVKGIEDPELVRLIEKPRLGRVVASESAGAEQRLEDFLFRKYQAWTDRESTAFHFSPRLLEHLSWERLSRKLWQIMVAKARERSSS